MAPPGTIPMRQPTKERIERLPVVRQLLPGLEHDVHVELRLRALERQAFLHGEQDLADAEEADHRDEEVESLEQLHEPEGKAQLSRHRVDPDGGQSEAHHHGGDGLERRALGHAHERAERQEIDRKEFRRAELEREPRDDGRDEGDEHHRDQGTDEGRGERRRERRARAPLLRQRIAVEGGRDRPRLARDVEQDRGDGAAEQRAPVDAREQDDGGGGAAGLLRHGKRERQQDRHAVRATPLSGGTGGGGGVVALNGLDLSVAANEIIGLIGPNGSGKTTFFNVITGIYGADEGQVTFGGANITRAASRTVYQAGISRTFQRSRLSLSLSIFDNIMIGNHKRLNQGLWFNLIQRGKFKQEFEKSYRAACALVEVFEPALTDRMFEPVTGLPMIDRRRIEICRALISEPKLLLLDEPSAGMTHDETKELMNDILLVRERNKDLTIIIVEHEMGVIERITNRCVVLNFGRKIAEGPYREVAANAQVQEAYLGVA